MDYEVAQQEEQSLLLQEELNTAIEAINETLGKIAAAEEKKEYFDTGLKEALVKTVETIGKINNQVTVNVDIKPIEVIASRISDQNKNILGLINGIKKDSTIVIDNTNLGNVLSRVVSMVELNNEFIRKGFNIVDQKDVNKLTAAVEGMASKKSFKLQITKRDFSGKIETAIITTT